MEPMQEPAQSGRRIAFFGGSFDPPHLGHIGIARAAQKALHLDTVLFVPVGVQPLKPMGATASYEDRVAMTELAIKGLPRFAISLADAPEPTGEPNFTIDTLNRLEAQFPMAQFFTLIGADSLLSFDRWYRGAEIPFVAPLIVASRPGQHLEQMTAHLPEGLSLQEDPSEETKRGNSALKVLSIRNQAGASAPFYVLPDLEIGISATEIRQQAGSLDQVCADREFLPKAVCDYIETHGLYR
jgi:nicotinate-nucleotide adenylyltransferase